MISKLWTTVWHWLSRPHATIALGVLLGGGIAVGVIGLAAFDASMAATSTDEFCVSCHELEINIGVDYETRSHASNPRGVRAGCADCHVPEPLVPKYMRKARAIGEIYHHIAGTIDTPEKFEAHRMTMATRVWRDMLSNDSRECRSCHDADRWIVADQSERAREFHETSMTRGKTCISCHKGVAHVLPAGIEEDSELDDAAASSSTHSIEKSEGES